jgi:hypothetical protein
VDGKTTARELRRDHRRDRGGSAPAQWSKVIPGGALSRCLPKGYGELWALVQCVRTFASLDLNKLTSDS